MFPPTKRLPKRMGGAPFTTVPSSRRGQPRQPLSARSSSSRPAAASDPPPSSARGRSSGGACRGDGAATPCTGRAEQYYSSLMGRPNRDTRQDWTLVQEIDALDFFNTEDQKRRSERERKMRNQEELKEQLMTRDMVAEKCRGVWRQWRSELEEDVAQFQKEEEDKRAFNLQNQRRFNQERERQLEEMRRRKSEQREEEQRLEREIMDKAEQAKKRQDDADEKLRDQRKRNALEMRDEAVSARERKQLAKKEEHIQDIKMAREYQELLDEQERNRGKYFQEIRAKQQELVAKYESGVGNELARLQARDDERARKQAEARQEKERQDAEERERWRQQLAMSGRLAVQQQLARQAFEREEKREEEQRYFDKQQREAAIAEAREVDKDQRKKEARHANADFIRKQIQEKEALAPVRKVEQAQMNEVERCLNREKLQRACDPSRADGLQSLLNKKRAEYRSQKRHTTALPC